MDSPRWWHVAVLGTAAALSVVVLASGAPTWRQAGALIALAAFVIGWFTVGRLTWQRPGLAPVFAGIVILTVSVGVTFLPFMAILQCVAYPVLWVTLDGLRRAIVANVMLAVAVGIGYWVSTLGLLETLLTSGLSLAFSLALGLWITRIADRSTERQRLLDELTAAQEQLASLSRDAGVASERERLAREIHDTIAQDLTALVMLTERSRTELAAGRPEVALQQLGLLEDSARSALAETRALVAASAPVGLGSGIVAALERLAERFTRESGIPVRVDANELPTIHRDTEVVVLRVAQEGLANVRKHAHAASVALVLAYSDGSVSLTVRDDGGGFDPSHQHDGFGLDGMRQRLALVGGSLDVASSTRGTALTARLPIAAHLSPSPAPSSPASPSPTHPVPVLP